MSPIPLRQSISRGTLGKCSVVSVDRPAVILACALGAGPRDSTPSRSIFVLSARIDRKASSIMSRSGAPWRWYWVEGAHPQQEDGRRSRLMLPAVPVGDRVRQQCYWFLQTSCAPC